VFGCLAAAGIGIGIEARGIGVEAQADLAAPLLDECGEAIREGLAQCALSP
jgi:hypothetical protein